MCGPNDRLLRQIKISFDFQPLLRVSMSVNSPSRSRQQFLFLIFRGDLVGLIEPFVDRRIGAVDELSDFKKLQEKAVLDEPSTICLKRLREMISA
jgi:hypothetical protein